jgi:hypothetical protein
LLIAREAIAIDDSVAPGARSRPAEGARRDLDPARHRMVLEIRIGRRQLVATGDNIGGIAIYDTKALELMRIVRAGQEGMPLAISPDGATVAQIAPGQGRVSLAFISTTVGSIRPGVR